ncbi:hypothetical protein [Sediminibacillus massiliensis]|uniref:hypothetical protein n=1 Tax=Sediminibacillus massiliensis TaxID=1926277 RepID=UPI00098843FE|nr:hypothetical protein [Sediminibacillus massiliensis]
MNRPHHHKYDLCKKHMHQYVMAEMEDGSQVDGIVTDLDEDFVYLAVPISAFDHHEQMSFGQMQDGQMPYGQYPQHEQMPYGQYPQHEQMPYGQYQQDYRQFGWGYPGYGGFGYGYPGYGYGYPGRRFRRLVLPLTALAALSALPWY